MNVENMHGEKTKKGFDITNMHGATMKIRKYLFECHFIHMSRIDWLEFDPRPPRREASYKLRVPV